MQKETLILGSILIRTTLLENKSLYIKRIYIQPCPYIPRQRSFSSFARKINLTNSSKGMSLLSPFYLIRVVTRCSLNLVMPVGFSFKKVQRLSNNLCHLESSGIRAIIVLTSIIFLLLCFLGTYSGNRIIFHFIKRPISL